MRIPTVKIKNGDGFAVINKDDFDEGKHALFEGSPKLDMTPKGIDKMSKGDVRELLEIHGIVDLPKSVNDMRELLKKTMFLEH